MSALGLSVVSSTPSVPNGRCQQAHGHRLHLMRRVLAFAIALVAAGCSSKPTAVAPTPAVGDASRVDMCTILTDAELTGMGIKLASRKPTNRLGLVGCGWNGLPFTL